jgi:hypothetical protein
MPPRASLLVEVGIAGLALVVCACIALGVRRFADPRYAPRVALGLLAWLALSGALSYGGFFAATSAFPPRFLWLMAPTFALPLWLASSRAGAQLASAPIALLVGFHVFRLPLELVMHVAADEGVMPVQMTFTGRNFDIVSGASALLVAVLAALGRAPRWLLLAWNALATLLLVNIIVVAVASLPFLRLFGDEPSRVNTWVAHFPFVWLPAGLVSAAVLGHSLLWRRLLSRGMRGRVLPSFS